MQPIGSCVCLSRLRALRSRIIHLPLRSRATQKPSNSVSTCTSTCGSSSNKTDSTGADLRPPVEPGPEECCRMGCQNCVWDIYRLELKAYEDYLHQKHPDIAPLMQKTCPDRQSAQASLNAFEQLERKLQLQSS